MRRASLFTILAFIFLSVSHVSVDARTFTVKQGNCEGAGSLRDAVDQANKNPGKDVIDFDPSVRTIAPTGSCQGPDPLPIRITDSVDITGGG